ncbi:hypothetical protein [Glycomyces dulcitolivorans]|uniref:hypothetical protein n=1 Tax=Glycomyces dulcitolivorans TaxID=2200759 RepID=UPI000DD3F845|nr:hypothetical protein [Glycomyces dulcitolivorans]
MRIRLSIVFIPFMIGLCAFAGPIAVLRDPDWEVDALGMLQLAGVTGFIGAAISVPIYFFANNTYVLPEYGIATRNRRDEYHLTHALEEGERFVLKRNCLYIERADNSLLNMRYRKWAFNRKDWKRLEANLPVLEPVS